ncbi:GNAT family N-acetyltransferase [Tumebacillus sp. DT12]|uniref:GNAT family N-acetyltransferase n=1 Tax=Tumebacillus lacus TaxID=2995335 RepID=A0ABT3WY91_9BACL|nr:GNAT family N-acetyltransferase [Tumebacillus lacus]MCX7569645.1 GNAT family N-acetyltransferase [Tumebacillus lacus]
MLHAVQKRRDAYLPLLLLADPSEEAVRRYLEVGELYAWLSEEDETIGVMHVLAEEEATPVVELKNVSVRERYQGQGHGKQMVEAVLTMLRQRGVREVKVATGNSSIGNLAFYQKLGFRMTGIEHDYFLREYSEPITENGIPCRDRIHFARTL